LLNGAIDLIGSQIADPLAVAIEDERFVWRHFVMMQAKIGKNTLCLFSPPVLRAICEHDPDWLIDRPVILIDNFLKPYGKARRKLPEFAGNEKVLLHDTANIGISLAPQEGVFPAGSVAYSALQFALACKPEVIGIAGIDLSNATEPRFYENNQNSAWSGIETRDSNLFSLQRYQSDNC